MMRDGFINLNKDIGISSQSAVAAIKRLLHAKTGHCGTLDPEASGVLPICLGKATRLSELVMGERKNYLARVCFGIATDSYDAAGTVTATADAGALRQAQLQQVLPQFIGRIEQMPPLISALKKDGVPLYKRARRGEQISVQPRQVEIDSISLLGFEPGNPAYADIEVSCGKGTYIRSLAFDLGRALNLPAHLCALQRTATGGFAIERSYTLEQIREMVAAEDFSFILPMNQIIGFIPEITVDKFQTSWVSHGNDLAYQGSLPAGSLLRVLSADGRLLALGRIKSIEENKIVKMEKVLIDAFDNIACAIGNFDGLHLGHRALFAALADKAQEQGSKREVLTFEPHPLTLIRGESPELLTGNRLKTELLVNYFGVDKIIKLEFNQKLMNSSPEEFVQDIIIKKLRAKHIIVGYNFTFAAEGRGDAALLRQLCAAQGIEVSIIDQVSGEYGVFSSSNIRRHLQKGDLPAVNAMLGYWFVMQGEVIYGNQLGRSLGYPTANFCPESAQAVPMTGAYAARIDFQGKTYDGVANFGIKPTIGGIKMPLVEAHLFDMDEEFYGETIRVWFGKHFANRAKVCRH